MCFLAQTLCTVALYASVGDTHFQGVGEDLSWSITDHGLAIHGVNLTSLSYHAPGWSVQGLNVSAFHADPGGVFIGGGFVVLDYQERSFNLSSEVFAVGSFSVEMRSGPEWPVEDRLGWCYHESD